MGGYLDIKAVPGGGAAERGLVGLNGQAEKSLFQRRGCIWKHGACFSNEVEPLQPGGNFGKADIHAQYALRVALGRVDNALNLWHGVVVNHPRHNLTASIVAHEAGSTACAATVY